VDPDQSGAKNSITSEGKKEGKADTDLREKRKGDGGKGIIGSASENGAATGTVKSEGGLIPSDSEGGKKRKKNQGRTLRKKRV